MIYATNNKGKIKQLTNLCTDIKLYTLKESNINIDVEEDGKTFEENAIKKAVEIYKITKKSVVGDDSGLCIDYFDGWPGVYTHRFIPNSTEEERNDAIIEKMVNIDEDLRTAKITCVLALCDVNGKVYTFKGEVPCKIVHKQRGDNFFGFDAIVELSNGKTLAELTDEEKIKVNARSIAFKKMINAIKEENIQID